MEYQGSCHCGAIEFKFNGPEIDSGLRCNCSICQRKGAVMTAFTVSNSDFQFSVKENKLATYQFGTGLAKHHFCNQCGIYPFHETMRKKGHYRINIGCIEGIDATELAMDTFDGASI